MDNSVKLLVDRAVAFCISPGCSVSGCLGLHVSATDWGIGRVASLFQSISIRVPIAIGTAMV